jgi:hypothetical protein
LLVIAHGFPQRRRHRGERTLRNSQALTAAGKANLCQFCGPQDGKTAKLHGLQQLEDGTVGADPEGQREDGGKGKPWTPKQRARAVP